DYCVVLALVDLGDFSSYFFFQAEDGIRDRNVTGVQTCALPISCIRCCYANADTKPVTSPGLCQVSANFKSDCLRHRNHRSGVDQIGRASCRERLWRSVVAGGSEEKNRKRPSEERMGRETTRSRR